MPAAKKVTFGDKDFLSTSGVAEYFGWPFDHVAARRKLGLGPAPIKAGTCTYYPFEDTPAWRSAWFEASAGPAEVPVGATERPERLGPPEGSLVGCFGHTFEDDGGMNWQFELIGFEGGLYQVQLFSWLLGHPTEIKLLSLDDLRQRSAALYRDIESWRKAGDAGSRARPFKRRSFQ